MPLTYFKRFRMEVDLAGRDFPAPALPLGYELHAWGEDLLSCHAEAKHASFCAEIDAYVFPCLGDADGCRRLMGEIRAKDTFLPQATWLLSYQPPPDIEPEYCGTIQGLIDRSGMGAIQNLGITPEHRGRGLGTALLCRSLEGFQQAGLARTFLEVTAQNEGAVRLYERLGFKKVRTLYKAVEAVYAT